MLQDLRRKEEKNTHKKGLDLNWNYNLQKYVSGVTALISIGHTLFKVSY